MIKKRLLHFLILSIVMLVSFKIAQARSLSMHFVDEEDHITIARYTNIGYKLYQDIQSNHQPIVYFTSAKLQQLLDPENIFMLVRRHRQGMFVYGLIWSLLIVWRFKITGLIFVLFFEFLKYYLFGNLWLMESFAVYPAVYLFGVMLETWINKIILRKIELIFLGFCSFLVIFNLVPLWPWLALVWLILLIKLKKRLKWLGLGLLSVIIILFTSNCSPVDWFRETIYNNFVYAIPALSPYKGPVDWLKMVFFPFLSFLTKNSLQAKFIAFFFSGWLFSLGYLMIKKDKRAIKFGLIYFFLLLANNRVLSPGTVYYQGFHLLPWLGLMIFTFGFSLKLINFKFWPIFFIWGIALMANKSMPYFLKTDVANEYYINFSTIEDVNFAIKNIAKPDDRLAVLANQPIIYWQTRTRPATRQLVYYGWEPSVPNLKADYERVFYGNNPPEIIYGDKEVNLMLAKYINIQRDNKPTLLFIRKDRYNQITDQQWQSLNSRGFTTPL